MRHIIPISGKDSLATAIWQTARDASLPYEYVFNDTRAELPDTYDWLSRVECVLKISITRIGRSLKSIIEGHGILPSAQIRFCTKDAKIRPMNRFIGKDKAVVYFGLRADEPERVGALETGKLQPVYPLREANIGLAAVYRLVGERGLLPPKFFWKRLYDAVLAAMGPSGVVTLESWPEWMKDRIFAWRSRPNCFFCFFQRRYEWIGLLEHHPALFDEAERMERETGKGPQFEREQHFAWIAEDWPLSRIREHADRIFQSRVDAVSKLIDASRQSDLFRNSLDEIDIAGTSCGLLCGK